MSERYSIGPIAPTTVVAIVVDPTWLLLDSMQVCFHKPRGLRGVRLIVPDDATRIRLRDLLGRRVDRHVARLAPDGRSFVPLTMIKAEIPPVNENRYDASRWLPFDQARAMVRGS